VTCGTRERPLTVAPFRSWRGSRFFVARGPTLVEATHMVAHRRRLARRDVLACSKRRQSTCSSGTNFALRARLVRSDTPRHEGSFVRRPNGRRDCVRFVERARVVGTGDPCSPAQNGRRPLVVAAKASSPAGRRGRLPSLQRLGRVRLLRAVVVPDLSRYRLAAARCGTRDEARSDLGQIATAAPRAPRRYRCRRHAPHA
jgi:hypothetical protein